MKEVLSETEPEPANADNAKAGKKSKFAALFSSRLSRVLLSLFISLAILEAVFISVLCYDIIKSNEAANKAIVRVETSQKVTTALDAAHHFWSAHSQALEHINTGGYKAILQERSIEFRKRREEAFQKLPEIGVRTDLVEKLRSELTALNKISDELETKPIGSANALEELYQKAGLRAFDILYKIMRNIHSLEIKQPIAIEPLLGLSPQYLMIAAAVANTLLLSAMVFYIEKTIRQPVSRLYSDCERIKLGTALEKPKLQRSEIGALQESFHTMSVMVAENDKRRKNYLEFLQAVQTEAMINVRAWFDQLTRSTRMSEKALGCLKTSRTNLSMLIQLLNSMTETLQDADGKVNIHCKAVTTKQLLQQAVSGVDALVRKRKINLVIGTDDYNVVVDSMLITRVLINLLSNAIKYSPQAAEVKVAVSKNGDMLRFSVTDSGPGMEKSEQAKLFQKFSMVNAADGVKRAGSGLGLLICRGIIEAHGGEIGCESEPGKGSCFWFKIPQNASNAGISSNNDSSDSRVKKAKRGAGRSIKQKFLMLFITFLGLQAIVFWSLTYNLAQSDQRAIQFSAAKKILFESQELNAVFLFWGKQMEVAVKDQDFATAKKSIDLLRLQKRLTQQLIRNIEADPYTTAYSRYEIVVDCNKMLAAQNSMLETADYAFDHFDELSDHFQEIIVKERDKADIVQNALFDILRIENQRIVVSKGFSEEIFGRIILTLIIASLGDFVVIVLAALISLSIAERIATLKSKADEFGKGEHIFESLNGDDELSHLDRRLCQVSTELIVAEAKRQELLAVINHDLRTPLTSILGSLELLSDGVYGPIVETDSALVSRSERELGSMISGVNDLLTIEKIEAGKLRPESKRLQISEILEESLDCVTKELEERGALMSVSPDARFSEAEIYGDRQLLVRLCAIVLVNAIKASPKGEQVLLKIRQDENKIVTTIEDHGSGITPELLPEIFDRFRFLDGKPVTGLGLPLADRLCKLHGGSIEIKHSNDTGTFIEIALPLAS